MDVDAIKVDSQGLDRAILESGQSLLERTFYVECEPGFLENYRGENTFSEVDIYLKDKGFLLFDMELYRSARNNGLGKASPKQQLMWCQGIWLNDLIARPAPIPLTRGKALKTLLLCAVCATWDFGLELAEYYCQRELLSPRELDELSLPGAWEL